MMSRCVARVTELRAVPSRASDYVVSARLRLCGGGEILVSKLTLAIGARIQRYVNERLLP